MAKIGMFDSLGRIGQYRYSGIFHEEYLKELRGPQGVEVYKEMENDETVSAILFAIKNLMRQATFSVEPAGDSEVDKKAAEFIEQCMDDMEMTWNNTLSEIMSFLVFGWSYHEIVYKRRMGNTNSPKTKSKYDDGLVGWRKLPIRAQETLFEWVFEEGTDDLIGMIQQPPPDFGNIEIPLEKALHFITEARKNNPEGRSILRGAYSAWYKKRRIQDIEGIGIERDLAGFPVLTAPEGMDLWDIDDPDMVAANARAEHIVSTIKRDSREGAVFPPGWKLELLSGGGRRNFDTSAIIDRYDRRIAGVVLADFIFLGQGDTGSWALSSDKTRLFSLAIGSYLDNICETFNNQGIPRLIDLNGDAFKGITDYPQMVHSDIEDRNITELASFLKEMVGIGLLVPDDDLEDFVRREGKLPERLDTGEVSEPTLEGEEKKEFRLDQASTAQSRQKGEEGEEKPEMNNDKAQPKKTPEKPKQDIENEDDDEELAKSARKALGR